MSKKDREPLPTPTDTVALTLALDRKERFHIGRSALIDLGVAGFHVIEGNSNLTSTFYPTNLINWVIQKNSRLIINTNTGNNRSPRHEKYRINTPGFKAEIARLDTPPRRTY